MDLLKTKTYTYTRKLNKKTINGTIYYNIDKFLNITTRINPSRGARPLNQIDQNLQNYIKETEQNCPFCYNHIEAHLPKNRTFPKKHKESIIFHNLYPFSKEHYVCTLTKKHYLKLNDFSKAIFQECFENIAYNIKLSPKTYINMNYLLSAGASLVHPHIQIINEPFKTPLHKTIQKNFKKINKWIEEHNVLNKTIIFENTIILENHAPILNNQITAIFEGGFKENTIKISKVLEITLKAYSKINENAFNFTIFEEKNKTFLIMGTRTPLKAYYTTDFGFLESLHQTYTIEKTSILETIKLILEEEAHSL